jgi:hypothetical protein
LRFKNSKIAKLKFPDDLENGPIKNRSCTDMAMGFFFILFLIGMFACSVYGWTLGNPKLLLIGWDSDHRGCGLSNETLNYPFLYWPQLPDNSTITAI